MGARYVMAIMFSGTLCVMAGLCTAMLWQKLINLETFLAVVTPFILIVREITDAYFKREDRKQAGS
jgi:hypothetical protein